MKLRLALLTVTLCSGATAAGAAPLIRNPSMVNIGFVCRWQPKCIERQERSMKRALKYVRKTKPPTWKIHLCNRNASRGGTRVDWIGFDNCIRNPNLRPPRSRRSRR